MELMPFRDNGNGAILSFVGKKSLFTSKEEFVENVLSEFEDDFSDLDPECLPTIDDVKESHCRFYPILPEGFDIQSGYTFCEPGKGAFGVYYIDFS
ncbi:hypothetical protein ACFVS2_25690 [Brevibacillus sp. NPDC058079]|uniref:hypothetical protein n=1 Tax=Brevibacillus sp. NPDC058079 TaxID=3346330 RepID=UPI0036E6070A